MDGAKAIAKVYRGYGKVASKIGFDYDLYRAQSQFSSPISNATKVTTLKVSLNQKGDYKVPNSYGVAIWWSYHDGRLTQVGDYVVGRMGTFFIASQQDLLPIQMVSCNRVATIRRPTHDDGVGAVSYGGDVVANDEVLMQDWPCSILQGRDEKNDLGLPLDSKRPTWKVLLPYIDGAVLRSSDIITDDLGRRYSIATAELTDLGWRLSAIQLEA